MTLGVLLVMKHLKMICCYKGLENHHCSGFAKVFALS